MRKLMQILLVAGFAVGVASQASALATVTTLVNGSSSVSGLAPGPVTIDIIVDAGAEAITGYSVTLLYDNSVIADAGIAVAQFNAPEFDFPLPPATLLPGQVQSMAGAVFFGTGLAAFTGKTVATITANYLGGGAFLEANFSNPGVDGVVNNGGAAIPTQFVGATIVPEPTTAALFALGLCGVAWSGRRRES